MTRKEPNHNPPAPKHRPDPPPPPPEPDYCCAGLPKPTNIPKCPPVKPPKQPGKYYVVTYHTIKGVTYTDLKEFEHPQDVKNFLSSTGTTNILIHRGRPVVFHGKYMLVTESVEYTLHDIKEPETFLETYGIEDVVPLAPEE